MTPPTITVNNPISRNLASFLIKKSVVNTEGATGIQSTFTVYWSCKIGTTTVASGSVGINTTTAVEVKDVPAGSTCSVTSETAPTPITDFTWTTPASLGSSVIADNPASTITVTNTITRGDRERRHHQEGDGPDW